MLYFIKHTMDQHSYVTEELHVLRQMESANR